jgi:alkaline phosphatase
MIRTRPFNCLLALAALPLAACQTAEGGTSVASASAPAPELTSESAQKPAPEPSKAKNVILFIGDGMGISTITAARIYEGQKRGETGEENLLSFENFDNVALVKTYNTNAQVPDSAGTATAMHSGKKTRIGVLGIGPEATRSWCPDALAHPLPLLGEEAKAKGLALGIVSTARITHATPASVYARSADRNWEADSAMPVNQLEFGCRDIATQLVEADWDVALGGGSSAFYGEDGQGRRRDAAADLPSGWAARTGGTFVRTNAELAAAPADKPVLGLFSPSHMTYMAQRLEEGSDAGASEPTLTEMTSQAIARLKNDPDGFYLMVESGRIDHGHHAGIAGYALEETLEFAKAIQYAVENTDSAETLIMVTADHSHVFTIAGYPRRGNDILGLVVPPEGEMSNPDEPLPANDGKPYTTLGYGNGPGSIANLAERPMPETGVMARQQSAIPLGSETHAGEDVALYATGPGAEKARGVIEQNVIYDIIRSAYGWE